MRAVRVHRYHEDPSIDDIGEPKLQRPARRHRQDRRRRGLPHRPAHPRGPVGRGAAPRAALRHRARERRLGARGRRGRHQRRRRRHGDPASAAQLRAVPRLPRRQGHAVRERVLPRPVQQRRRHGRVPADDGAGLREARPAAPTPPTSRRSPTPGSPRTTPSARPSRCCTRGRPPWCRAPAGSGTSASSASAALTAARIVVVDKNPDALKLAGEIGADETVRRRRQPRGRRPGPHRRRGAGRLRLRRRAGRGDGRLEHDRAGRLATT